MSPKLRGRGGFTLVELLVAMGLFVVLGSLVMPSVLAVSRGLDNASVTTDISAEARTALNRIARELRQAKALTAANPQQMTVNVDFDADGVIQGSLSDPEVVSYSYDATAKSVSLTATVPGESTTTQPLLAGQVTALTFTYHSSNWIKDANGDGTVTLAEAGIDGIDRVKIDLTVGRNGRSQTYSTDVTLRNRSQS